MLPQPPTYATYRDLLASIKLGEKSWRAFAVQQVVGVPSDGHWGPQTEEAVRTYQRRNGLVVDGIVGPATQGLMLERVATEVDERYKLIPNGLLDGFARVEGANVLAATNWYTPPKQRVGVDCGPSQIRIYRLDDGTYPVADYSVGEQKYYGLRSVFDPKRNFTIAAQMFTGRIVNYRQRNSKLSDRQIVEAAVLAHNAPFLAEQIVRQGYVSTPHAIAAWTTIPQAERSKYDGRSSYSHFEWSKEYPRRVLLGVH